jgi:glycolate oxidase FAD binding subunit
MSNLAARVKEAAGVRNVVSAPEELVAYAIDGLSPALIVRPCSAIEVADVVKFAIAEKLKMVPLGSRSKCEMGMAPTRYDIALDMTGLHDIAHYDAGDMTLSIDAGKPLREVEEFLREHGQFLPLAVPCFESTTAGGTIASGIDSVLRQQYGTARDFLIGAEFVDGKGQLCKSGGRVVKNVTGYELHKLLIGSLGTLGLITRVNFRTFPLPAISAGYLATFSKSAAALEYRKMLAKAGVPLTNLELISPEAGNMIRAILQRGEQPVPDVLQERSWWAYCSFEGNEAVVKRISAELERLARGAGSRNLRLLESSADEMVGGMLREGFEWLRWAAEATVLYRLALCGDPTEAIATLSDRAESLELRSALLLRSCGIVYFAIFAESDEEIVEPAQALDSVAVALARSLGGHSSVLYAPLKAKLKIVEGRGDQARLPLHQRVKKAFDPSGIFVPGRVVGEI